MQAAPAMMSKAVRSCSAMLHEFSHIGAERRSKRKCGMLAKLLNQATASSSLTCLVICALVSVVVVSDLEG